MINKNDDKKCTNDDKKSANDKKYNNLQLIHHLTLQKCNINS
jgi:hypothetical protein